MLRMTAAVALVVAVSSSAVAQDTASANRATARLHASVAGGMSRHGAHAFGAPEVAINSWLALRVDVLFGVRREVLPGRYRHSSMSLTSILTLPTEQRVTPYLLGGYALTVSQGHQAGHAPLIGGGLRVQLWRLQPFVETRAQRGLGVPVSLGLRF